MLRQEPQRFNFTTRKSALLIAGLFLLFASCFNDDEVDFDAQLKADLALIDQYLAERNIVALTDPENKIRYVIHKEGTGVSPRDTNCVKATYEGRIMETDKVFASGTESSFPLSGDLIEGWKIGLPLLQVGDEATLYIPSILAYGPTGIPIEGIDPNQNVLFHFKMEHVGKNYSPTPSPTGTCN
jgi:FKBP-type peptidyl-prolyl cis-trans isomerase